MQAPATGGLLSGSILDLLSVLNMDAGALDAQQEQALEAVQRSGGVVVNPPARWQFPPVWPDQTSPDRRQLDRIQPIWERAYDATVRKNFGVRTFNTASVIFNLLATPDGKSLLVHLVNYADYATEDVTVQVVGPWRRARLYSPGREVRELPVYPGADGTGIDIDRIGVIASLRLD